MRQEAFSPVFRSIRPENILSFGPNTGILDLLPLNVLIGPNGSGKSNLLEILALARSTPADLRGPLRRGGGVRQWVWQGAPESPAAFEIVAQPPGASEIGHCFRFAAEGQTLRVADERITGEQTDYSFNVGRPKLQSKPLSSGDFDLNASILSQLKDPVAYPEITWLSRVYSSIRLYRAWTFGQSAVFRQPQPADARNDRLEEDFSNLGMYLSRIQRAPAALREIRERLRDLYEGVDDFEVIVEGGTVQVFFTEGDYTIPATRLSDGTLRYLCLLAILCDPDPPPLVCIEEPELGLHPDILPKIASLLVEASKRMQLIVTTHSEIIVDALTDYPESIVVCEKHAGQTAMRRLDRADLAEWLEKYRLGQLWTRGQLGGIRW